MAAQLSSAQANAILQFLARAQIVGADAPTFMECVMALRMIVSPPQDVSPDMEQAKE